MPGTASDLLADRSVNLVPGIHVFKVMNPKDVDGRIKPG